MASAEKDYYTKKEVDEMIIQAKEEVRAELVRQMQAIIENNHSDISYQILNNQ